MSMIGLNCFNCGAPAAEEGSKCQHCGSRLTTVACPSCHGMLFAGSKHCPHCGSVAMQWESEPSQLLCPACDEQMAVGVSGTTRLHECSRCFGFWVDAAAVEQLTRSAEQQAAVMADVRLTVSQATMEENVQYRRCPHCREFMNRVNFARYSGVVVDVCRVHGTWFDKEELRRVLEFIRGGGMERLRQRQKMAALEDQRLRGAGTAPSAIHGSGNLDTGLGFDTDQLRSWISLGAGALWVINRLLSK